MLSLHVFLGTAEVFRKNGILLHLCKFFQISFFYVDQWTYDDMFAVFRFQLGRHAFQFRTEKQVQEKGFQHIVTVVSERDFRHAEFTGDFIKNTPAKA